MFYLILLYSAGKIQISNSTNMILDMQGGFLTKERGGVDVKVSLEIELRIECIIHYLQSHVKPKCMCSTAIR